MSRRFALAVSFAALIASPAFNAYAEGEEEKKEGGSLIILSEGEEEKKEGGSLIILSEGEEEKKEGGSLIILAEGEEEDRRPDRQIEPRLLA